MKDRSLLGSIAVLSLLGSTALLALGMVPAVYASTSTVNSSWCSGAGFSWNSGTSTCTLTTGYSITSGNTLEIPSGTTLIISGISGAITVFSGGTLTVDSGGILDIENCCTGGGPPNMGITNDGTISNSGRINIDVGTDETGIVNENTITNSGTIDVKNGGSFTIGILTGEITTSTIANYGTIDIETPGTGSIGIDNSNVLTITNECSGTITGTILGGYTQDTSCSTATTGLTTVLSHSPVSTGVTVSDNAILSGGNAPTGTITFYYTTGSVCPPTVGSATQIGSPITVSGNGVYTSSLFSFASPGTYNVYAVYNGDSANAGSTSACEPIVVQSTTVSAPQFPLGILAPIALLLPVLLLLRRHSGTSAPSV